MFFFNRKKNKNHEENEADEVQTEEMAQGDTVEETSKDTVDEKEVEKQPAKEKELLGYALFENQTIDIEEMVAAIKLKAGLDAEIEENAEHPTFIVTTPEGSFVCTHVATPVPEEEIQRSIQINPVEPEKVEAINNHQSFIIIKRVAAPYKDRISACVDFSKIASVLMMQPGALGMYVVAIKYLLSAERYTAFFNQMMQAQNNGERFFPIPLWVKVSMYQVEDGLRVFTYGLSEFGIHELGFEKTKRAPQTVFNMLMNLCEMYLVQKCQFQDGDTMRLEPQTDAVLKLEDQTLYVIEN